MSKIKSEKPDKEVYEIAICLSRMWGVAETLEPLPNVSFETVRDVVIVWAEEFLTGEEKDLVRFFIRKIKEEQI